MVSFPIFLYIFICQRQGIIKIQLKLLLNLPPIEIITVYMSNTMGRIVADHHLLLVISQNLQLNDKAKNFSFATFMIMSFASLLP
ncbi:MAG: hypothetical protein B1H13_08735 [Desulfobacteraceae bacterium 4484_190.3]|nr:MAG: hypothetical protein B1H13_08735 [Desulfobacteraceae bacterium 4484_190.3]